MLLLISPINTEEALEAIEGGADIVDVKNPKEGSLGASFPWIIKGVREMTPKDMLVSATLGDVPYKPGTVSLAAMGALVSIYDINLQLTSTLQKEITNVLKTNIEIDNNWHSTPGKYQYIIDATPVNDLVDTSLITSDTYIVAPGVPSGISPEAQKQLSDRYLHDPLQIGTAAMVMDACKNSI